MADLDERFIDDLVRKTAGDAPFTPNCESFHHSAHFRDSFSNPYGIGTITAASDMRFTSNVVDITDRSGLTINNDDFDES